MWWNFVARTRDELDSAYRQWQADNPRFGRLRSPLARIPARKTLLVAASLTGPSSRRQIVVVSLSRGVVAIGPRLGFRGGKWCDG